MEVEMFISQWFCTFNDPFTHIIHSNIEAIHMFIKLLGFISPVVQVDQNITCLLYLLDFTKRAPILYGSIEKLLIP